MDIALSVSHILPAADYRRADDYAALVETWADSRPVPTEAEILAVWSELEAGRIATESIKQWPNVQSFMAEFLPEEIHAIANSTIPEVITSRFLLSTWLGHVVSNDPRITQGLDLLLYVGIITNERRQQIITVPT